MESDPQPGVFATTHWSVVLSAQDLASPQAEQALDQLCRTYWYPLYAFLRRLGHASADAEDLTQGFLAYWKVIKSNQKHSPASPRK